MAPGVREAPLFAGVSTRLPIGRQTELLVDRQGGARGGEEADQQPGGRHGWSLSPLTSHLSPLHLSGDGHPPWWDTALLVLTLRAREARLDYSLQNINIISLHCRANRLPVT